MTRPPRATLLAAATWCSAFALVAPGCSDDDPAGPEPDEIQVQADGFAPNAHKNGRFELWISFALTQAGLRHSAAASAGRFQIDASGNVLSDTGGPMHFAVDPESELVPTLSDGSVAWQLAVDAFVTFEPAEDPEPEEPNLPGIVGASFLNGTAVLTTDYADALDQNFSSVSGSFHLATPTTTSTADEIEGVWFALPGGASPSLVLPALPAGWTYHGWLSVGFFGIRSLGAFTSVSEPDFDGPGDPQPDQDGTPYPFPGSVCPLGTTGVDFRGANVLVTLEPPADADGAGPSFLTLLAATIDTDQVAGTSVALGAFASFPQISIVIPVPQY